MKKIILLAVIVIGSLNLNAQRVWVWEDSINTASIVGTDTVLQPKNKDNLVGGGVGSYGMVCSVNAENLNANDAKAYIGGGVEMLRGSNKYYDFVPKDSVTLDRTVLDHIVNNVGIKDTMYTHIWTEDVWNFEIPMIKLKPVSVSAGYFKWRWVFNKQ